MNQIGYLSYSQQKQPKDSTKTSQEMLRSTNNTLSLLFIMFLYIERYVMNSALIYITDDTVSVTEKIYSLIFNCISFFFVPFKF